MKFKKGDRVIATVEVGDMRLINAVGTVLFIKDNSNLSIQFDKFIDGHDGSDYEFLTGKYIEGKWGYCWYVSPRFLKILNTNKRIS
jgi:hypothetical protein